MAGHSRFRLVVVLVGVVIVVLVRPPLPADAVAPTVCDFDGDGVDDLAVGIPRDVDHHVDRELPVGSVVVIRGGSPDVGLDFPAPVQQLFGWAVEDAGEVDHQEFGAALAAGAFVPGYPDSLVVGAPFARVDDEFEAGRAYVFRGGAGGLTTFQHVDQEYAEGWGPSAEPYDWFGFSLAGGDFDGDGHLDLAVGAPGEGLVDPDVPLAGMVAVIAGPFDGTVGYGDVTQAFQSDLGGADEWADRFGWSVATGDFDDDGRSDLAVGTPLEDVAKKGGTVHDAGAVFVFHGDPADLVGADGVILTQELAGTETSEPHDWFGLSLAGVPLFFGLDDLVIGIPGEEGPGYAPDSMVAGAVTIATGWPGAGPQMCSCFFLHQDTGQPFNVADQREASWTSPPFTLYPNANPTGELLGWSAAS